MQLRVALISALGAPVGLMAPSTRLKSPQRSLWAAPSAQGPLKPALKPKVQLRGPSQLRAPHLSSEGPSRAQGPSPQLREYHLSSGALIQLSSHQLRKGDHEISSEGKLSSGSPAQLRSLQLSLEPLSKIWGPIRLRAPHLSSECRHLSSGGPSRTQGPFESDSRAPSAA